MDDDGPRRGFSLKGWNENLPRNVAMQEIEFLGQLLTYMVMMNMMTLTITNEGINHTTHFLKCLISRYTGGVAGAGEVNGGVSMSTGCTMLWFRREFTLNWVAAAIELVMFRSKWELGDEEKEGEDEKSLEL